MTHVSNAPRVLVVAYDFPPHGSIGTMRTLRLVRHLHDDGWNVTVLTGSPDTYLPGTPVEPQLEAQIPPGVRVIRARAFRGTSALARMFRRPPSGNQDGRPNVTHAPASRRRGTSVLKRAKDFVDAALAIPDAESGWIPPAVASGLRHMAWTGRPDVIYSSAPPWSGQVVALTLARLSGRPWVADFRDPWSRAPWRDWRRAFRKRAVARIERRVIHRADAVLFVTRGNRDEFAAFYGPEAARKFDLVPNGCDPTEFEGLTPRPRADQFVLLHAGTLYGARTPMPLITAIARAVQREALDRKTFRLRLLGNVSLAVDVPAECRRLGIAEVVEFVPRVTRSEGLEEMMSASALLLLQLGTTVSVPGKAYEYLATGRPILALAEEGETAELVRASGIGVSVTPHAGDERIEAALLQLVALAGKAYAPPPRELYDGRVHAAETARTLLHHARSGRGARSAPAPPTAAAVGASAPTEEARR